MGCPGAIPLWAAPGTPAPVSARCPLQLSSPLQVGTASCLPWSRLPLPGPGPEGTGVDSAGLSGQPSTCCLHSAPQHGRGDTPTALTAWERGTDRGWATTGGVGQEQALSSAPPGTAGFSSLHSLKSSPGRGQAATGSPLPVLHPDPSSSVRWRLLAGRGPMHKTPGDSEPPHLPQLQEGAVRHCSQGQSTPQPAWVIPWLSQEAAGRAQLQPGGRARHPACPKGALTCCSATPSPAGPVRLDTGQGL